MSPSRAKRGSAAGARPAKPRLAPANKLKREIQAVLTHELADPPNRVGNGRYDGFRHTPAGLSRRARTIVERVEARDG